MVADPNRSHDEITRRIGEFLDNASVFLCAWSNRTALTIDSYIDGRGARISADQYDNNGFVCEVCNRIYPNAESNEYRDDYQCCDVCVSSGRVVWSDSRGTHLSPGEYEAERRAQEEEEEDEDEGDDDDNDISLTEYFPPPRVSTWGRHDPHRRGQIRNYSFNPMQVLDGFRYADGEALPLNPLWLGVELEVEPGSRASRDYVGKSDDAVRSFAVLKSDGSVGEGGFEIVSVPCTLEYHRKAWDSFFGGPSKELRSWDTGRCGMHVHIARSALSSMQLGKMLVFMGDDKNRSFLENIAGRGANSYTTFVPKKIRDGFHGGRNRYEALNTATGKPTVEIRIFRGTVAKAGFFKNLEFCDALPRFCADASPRGLASTDFLAWLDGRRHHYPVMTEWLVRRDLMRAARKPVAPAEPAYAA